MNSKNAAIKVRRVVIGEAMRPFRAVFHAENQPLSKEEGNKRGAVDKTPG